MKKEIKIYREDLRYFDRFVMENNIDLNCAAIYCRSIYLGDSPNNCISWDTDSTDDSTLSNIVNILNLLIFSNHILKFRSNEW